MPTKVQPDGSITSDASTPYEGQPSVTFLKMPEKSDWTCCFCGNVYFTPDKGKEPNWFHRKMQELCFGFKWRKK